MSLSLVNSMRTLVTLLLFFWGSQEVSLKAQDQPRETEIESPGGRFIRLYWYQRSLEHGNPRLEDQRIRVNAPETVLHPHFGKRIEARANGMIQILAEDSLHLISDANLYVELWGGHPGTTNKRLIVNGRSWHEIPEVGTTAFHCTYHYPLIPLKITDLVNGYNVFQFACDKGTSFWGHFLIDNACLRLELKEDHPGLIARGLKDFNAVVTASPDKDESFTLQLKASPADLSKISRVEYFGYYRGYDDNGNTLETDWHGYTKNKIPKNILGTAMKVPFKVLWNTAMLPDQPMVKVKAVVHFKDGDDLIYETPATSDIKFPIRRNVKVRMFESGDLPAPFTSRMNKLKTCTIHTDVDPSHIEKAQLHVIIWDGGEGTVQDHFKFNGKAFRVASGKHAHDVIYKIIDIDPDLIRNQNTIELLSDTEHHGIEILLPGPVLVIRERW